MKKLLLIIIVLSAGLISGFWNTSKGQKSMSMSNTGEKIATFAGGCFWCMEPPFEKLEGVKSVTAGYTGGKTKNPSYNEVISGNTGHYESVQIVFDPSVVSYETLLETFWQNIDPTDKGGQFYDRGTQYFTAVFYHDKAQMKLAEKSKKDLENSGVFDKPIVTAVLPAKDFYKAEECHQDYYQKEPERYNRYKQGSGRNDYFKKIWDDQETKLKKEKVKKASADMSKASLKKRLNSLQYTVTQENGTEPPFQNEYWDNKEEGIYVDIVSGTVLFSSLDKYDSGSGWPCFSQSVDETEIKTQTDWSHNMVRTEVRSTDADSHLGHIFDDNASPTGKRFCINSASLRFIPRDKLSEEGYGDYEKLFK